MRKKNTETLVNNKKRRERKVLAFFEKISEVDWYIQLDIE